MNNNLEQKIKAANGRLRANYCSISIQKKGGRLYLRGIFPPRPNSDKSIHYQQRISIANANDEGIKIAERTAKKISVQLDAKTFDWGDYVDVPETKIKAIADYMDEFEKDYYNRRGKTFKTETTFKVEYLEVFRHLPLLENPSNDLFKNIIITCSKPDTRSRKRFCSTLQMFAKFCGLDCDFSDLKGSYTQSKRQARNIPTDDLIIQYYSEIPDHWKWVYGMMATYGLRNHESFYVDLESLSPNKGIKILDGKTGSRQVWPFPPDWYDRFDLGNPKIPQINLNRTNREIGSSVTKIFNKSKIVFSPYDLRHAWAIRTLEYNLDISLAAKMQGHSLEVHSRLYHSWINEKTFQSAFDVAVKKKLESHDS